MGNEKTSNRGARGSLPWDRQGFNSMPSTTFTINLPIPVALWERTVTAGKQHKMLHFNIWCFSLPGVPPNPAPTPKQLCPSLLGLSLLPCSGICTPSLILHPTLPALRILGSSQQLSCPHSAGPLIRCPEGHYQGMPSPASFSPSLCRVQKQLWFSAPRQSLDGKRQNVVRQHSEKKASGLFRFCFQDSCFLCSFNFNNKGSGKKVWLYVTWC